MSRRDWPGLSLDPARADRRRCRLLLEALEERLAPALAVTRLADGLTPQDLVKSIVGSGVQVSNIKYTGVPIAAGTFAGGSGIIGPETGIVLTTGDAKFVIGPNNSDAAGTDNGATGDAQLTALAGGQTFNASVLEFDFVPQGNQLRFKYVFGSEEYNEFVNSQFNDVFAFFLNGQNIAKVPGTNQPVSVNNVNDGNPVGTNATNPQFFVNNSPAQFDTQLDGFTKVLPAVANVKPGQLNHFKIAIADTGDGILDSAVFIQAGTFSSGATTHLFATGADAGGGPHVKVYNPDGSLRFGFFAYDPSMTSGVRVATGDVNGDGVDDVITAPGPGGGPNVKAFDGATGALIASFFAFDQKFPGGVYIAVGEVSGTGTDDIIAGAGPGGGPHVKVFRSDGALLQSFFAFQADYTGGVAVSASAPDILGRSSLKIAALNPQQQQLLLATNPLANVATPPAPGGFVLTPARTETGRVPTATTTTAAPATATGTTADMFGQDLRGGFTAL